MNTMRNSQVFVPSGKNGQIGGVKMKYCCNKFKEASLENRGLLVFTTDHLNNIKTWEMMGFDEYDYYVPVMQIVYCPFCGTKLKSGK